MVRHNYVCDVLPSPRNSVENNEYVDESDLSHCTVTRLPLINYKQSVSSKIFSLIIKCIYINKKYNSPTNNVKNKDVCVRQMIS